ncbi:MAG TPA: type II toxin-antitoxin system RelE/ParE family toxin [Sphingomonas sp.]|jgi:toxin ParE1/3/4|nr:type II toxin-antitoxin system RelE/ParE family toxin [Sphingomonas sp.]
MIRLRVSAEARRDLQDIGKAGTLSYGRAASAAHLEGFRRLFGLLRDQPFAGQAWPELDLGVRSLSHRPHRILYRVVGEMVVIDRIVHQVRDIRHALGETP